MVEKNTKYSGIDYIGDIPNDWNIVPAKYLSSFRMGQTILKEDLIDDGIYPVYSATEKDTIFGYVNSPSFILKSGDIVIPARGNSIGFVKLVNYESTSTQTTIANFVDSDRINSKFLFYFYGAFRKQLFAFEDTAIPMISVEKIKENKIPVPPKQTQIRIAEFLDKKTAEIDTIIQKKENLLLLLEEKKKAIINEAITGKKVWNGNAWTEPVEVKDSGIEWIGEIPEHWEIKKFKYLVEYIESGCSVNAEDSPIENIDELGVLKTSCVYNYSFDDSENKKIFKEEYNRVKCPVKENTIIVSRMNTPELVGASGYVSKSYSNLYLPDRLWQLNFNNEYENIVEYISIILSSELYKRVYSRIATGSSPSMKNISQESYLDIDIILPPAEDSLNILEYIRNSIENLSVLKIKLTTQIDKLKEYRQSLISEAVTGKIDI